MLVASCATWLIEFYAALPSSPAISPSYPAGPYRFKNREYVS